MSDCFDHMADAYDSLGDDRDDDPNYRYRSHRYVRSAPRAITCNRCGARNLWWAPKHNRSYDWHLVTNAGDAHVCAVHDSEFEDLTQATPHVR